MAVKEVGAGVCLTGLMSLTSCSAGLDSIQRMRWFCGLSTHRKIFAWAQPGGLCIASLASCCFLLRQPRPHQLHAAAWTLCSPPDAAPGLAPPCRGCVVNINLAAPWKPFWGRGHEGFHFASWFYSQRLSLLRFLNVVFQLIGCSRPQKMALETGPLDEPRNSLELQLLPSQGCCTV